MLILYMWYGRNCEITYTQQGLVMSSSVC